MALLDKFRRKKSPDVKSGSRPQSTSGKIEKKPLKEKESPDVKSGSRPEGVGKKKQSKIISKKGALNAYRIIQRPHITEKAAFLAEKNKYVFRIFPKANKTEVKKVIQSLYGVKVEKVHIIHSSPKKRRLGRTQGFRHGLKKGFKKAIVTLKEGDRIELLPK